MADIKLFLRTVRASFFSASLIPVFLGAALAWQQGAVINGLFLVLAVVGILCIHAATNVMNDYFDFVSGNDQIVKKPSPFSGGSKVIQDKLLTPQQVFGLGILAYLVGIMIGLYLISQTDLRLF